MTESQRLSFKAVLEAKRQEVIGDIQTQTILLGNAEAEHDPFDQLQSMSERDKAAAMLEMLFCTLSQIDSSLYAMSEGPYGVCVECGEAIGLKRLMSIPWASCCVDCQEVLESRGVWV